MEITSKQILKFLNVVAWILFIGLCIEAGSFIFNAFFTFFINTMNASYLRLEHLYQFDAGYYGVIVTLMIIVAVLKALLFYIILKLLMDKTASFGQPFTKKVKESVKHIGYLALGIGLFCIWGKNYSVWLIEQGVQMPTIEGLSMGGGDVWLFMAVFLFIMTHLLKRAIELQTENELTI